MTLEELEYRLDLGTLLLMLGPGTGNLYSGFQHVPGVKKRCQVFLRLENGSIKSCSITDEYGEEIGSGEVALKIIQNQVLEWHYIENQNPSSPSPPQETPRNLPQTQPLPQSPLADLYSLIPQHTYPISRSLFLSWPRPYRTVYSLINGKVSINHIIRLLAREYSIEKIHEVLVYLQRLELIKFLHSPSSRALP